MVREKVTDVVLISRCLLILYLIVVFSYSISKITIHIAIHVFIYLCI